MDVLSRFGELLFQALDAGIGWILLLPRDVALVVFALGTAALMTVARRWITNQDLLHRCRRDLGQLKRRIREAKQAGDKSLVAGLRGVVGLIKGIQFSADMRVLIVVIVPIGILAVWAAERFDYFPPRVHQDLTVRAQFPISSVDRLTHLVPSPQFELKSTAIQQIRAEPGKVPHGICSWTLSPNVATSDLVLTIRHRGQTLQHHVAVGQTTYRPPQQVHDREQMTTEVELVRYYPLGIHIESTWIPLPPWMIGYLVLTLILVPGLKTAFGVA